MKPLTPTQANLLAILRSLPARHRAGGRAGAPLRPEVLNSYDGRSLRGLFERGLLRYRGYGESVEICEDAQ